MAWPIILANSMTPLLGIVDTAVIGHVGNSSDLGAIAMGALIFSFVFWTFGFLRMATTGFVAQADGAEDQLEIRHIYLRSTIIGVGLGAALIILQWPIMYIALNLFGASAAVEDLVASYFSIRIWSAPASLGLFVVSGVLIGLGKNTQLLKVQILLNGLNILLDCLFAGYFSWGVKGIALGTAISEVCVFLYAGHLVYHLLKSKLAAGERFFHTSQLWHKEKLRSTISANMNILIRTLFLLFSFAWFVDQGARMGDDILAVNHILLQFISLSAFFLDGFAFVSETLVGRAVGRKSLAEFDEAVRHSTLLAAITAVILSVGFFFLGPLLLSLMTDIDSLVVLAQSFLIFACLYILSSFAAFQLDGIFIGSSRNTAMRNASIVSSMGFILLCEILVPLGLNTGLWIAMIAFVYFRAIALLLYFPAIRHHLSNNT